VIVPLNVPLGREAAIIKIVHYGVFFLNFLFITLFDQLSDSFPTSRFRTISVTYFLPFTHSVMKPFLKPLFVLVAGIAITELSSWTFNEDAQNKYTAARNFHKSPEDLNNIPVAEDVLVQKIRGDKSHLLMMAFYSSGRVDATRFRFDFNGATVIFRDDGKAEDKVAGDGLFTCKINTDVNDFRRTAIARGPAHVREGRASLFRNSELIEDPDAGIGFDVKKFDNGDLVSIKNISTASEFDSDDNASSSSIGQATKRKGSTSTQTVTGTATASGTLSAIRANSIFVTDLRVVEDSTRTWNPCTQQGNIDGPWTFKTLMKQLASPNPATLATDAQLSTFVKSWLNLWATDQVIAGDTVKARKAVKTKILNPWLTKSQNGGAPAGQLDMRFAPFKLLAIVNRFDIRTKTFGNPAGEGRIVFCLVNNACTTAEQMNVIFEYHIPTDTSCAVLQSWATQWFNLKDLSLGSEEYNAALQTITDQFTLCGTSPSRPNQSSLNHLRTNDVALSPAPPQWELKEFVLDSTTKRLKENTCTQVAEDKYNAQTDNTDVERWVSFVNSNGKAVNNGSFIIPDSLGGVPFAAGKTTVLKKPTGTDAYYWDGIEGVTSGPAFIKNASVRHNISLFACSGCHSGETQTDFTHVDPVFFGTQATLSGFLSGKAGRGGALDADGDSTNDVMSVTDPAGRPVGSPFVRAFNDIRRRARDLKTVAETPCSSPFSLSSQLLFEPVQQVH
jgi:hypothetical protein